MDSIAAVRRQEFIEAQQLTLDRYDIDAESRFVGAPVIDGEAHVLVVGDGPPVVMVNGIGTPAAMWAPLMARLRGFTLFAVDLPGYGLTATTPHFTDDYRTSAVRFLGEVLDRLGLESVRIVANSLGSLWTTWLAVARPERVAALVHVGCPALILGTSAPVPMRMLSVPTLATVMMKLQPPSVRQVTQLSKMVHQHPLAPEIATLLLATERLDGFAPTFLATLHTLIRVRGARPAMELTADQLATVTQPAQFIWGADDPMGPPSVGERAVDIMTDAELHVVGGGHTPWLTDPERVGSLSVDFLSRA